MLRTITGIKQGMNILCGSINRSSHSQDKIIRSVPRAPARHSTHGPIKTTPSIPRSASGIAYRWPWPSMRRDLQKVQLAAAPSRFAPSRFLFGPGISTHIIERLKKEMISMKAQLGRRLKIHRK